MSDIYSIDQFDATPALGAKGARSARRRRPIDFQRTLEMMSALGEFKPISTEEARQGLEMAQALDGYPIDDRQVGQRDPIQLGAPRERFDPMALDETAMAEIPGAPRLDINDPRARRDAAMQHVLANPVNVESGGWGEAAMEALTSYLGGQSAARQFDRAQDESNEERFQERGRRNAMTVAAGMTDASPAMLASALSPYAPEEALQFSMEEGRGKREREQKREDAIWTLDQELDPGRAERRRGIAADDETALLRARQPFELAQIAARRRADGSGAAAGAIQQQQAEDVQSAIDRARVLANENGTTGLAGQIFSSVGGTNANDLRSTITTIKARVGFNALQRMREQSPTGAALGSVTERELDLLQSDIANLEQSQSREQFLNNLARVENRIGTIVNGPQAAGAADGGVTRWTRDAQGRPVRAQ